MSQGPASVGGSRLGSHRNSQRSQVALSEKSKSRASTPLTGDLASQKVQIQQDVSAMMADLLEQGLERDVLKKISATNKKFEKFIQLSDDLLNQNMDELMQQQTQQQEDFFKKIQEVEEELSQVNAKVELNEMVQQSKDETNIDATSYQEEETYAKQRKQSSLKFGKTSGKLQELIEQAMSDQSQLGQRVEAIQLIEQLGSIMDAQTIENKNQQLLKIKKDSKLKSLEENIKFLEQRLSQMLSEKEEQAIKLKSEIIIYKQKAKQYKEEMLQQKQHFENKNKEILAEKTKNALQNYLEEMRNVKTENQDYTAQITTLTNEKKECNERIKEFEKEYLEVVKEKDEIIQELKDKLEQINQKWEKKQSKVKNKNEDTQKQLNIEQKERELYGLKLEQVLINNKKLLLQKKFLEKQLEKDIRELQTEKNKILIEIQHDQLMNSSSALQRFRSVYQSVSDQLTYIQQIVGFMDFDPEGVAGPGGAAPPQSFEDIAKEFDEKIQNNQEEGTIDKLSTIQDQQIDTGSHGKGSPQQSTDGKQRDNFQNYISQPIKSGSRVGSDASRRSAIVKNPMSGLRHSSPPIGPLNLEECLNSYPRELLCSLLDTIFGNFKDVKLPESEHLTKLRELVQSQADKKVSDEIYEKFLHQNRVQFSQYVHKLKDKCKSLEVERKNLQFKVRKAKQDMEDHNTSQEMRTTPIQELTAPDQNFIINEEVEPSDRAESIVHVPASPAVPTLPKTTTDQTIDLLKQENIALKERCKEIRLNLQRRITELQDTLTISKQKYLTELSELKVEYGKDLNRITRSSHERQQEMQKQFDSIKEEEIEQLNREFEKKEEDLQRNIDENKQKAEEAIEKAANYVRDAERDLKKLKKESTGYFKGGWGTFVVAFEEDQMPEKILQGSRQTSKKSLQKQTTQPKSSAKIKKKKSDMSVKSLSSIDIALQEQDYSNMNLPHPLEKVSHFVEVGFLIDKNNFRLLDIFPEQTYDSNLMKYLYELQDPLDNFQMNDLEFKIKQQLMENIGLFNEINPVYISLDMGRPSTPFFDDYIPQEQFRLVKREGIYLMGDRWMMINFLKCDYLSQKDKKKDKKKEEEQPHQYILRVIAFENSTSQQFSFDLNYNDLLTLIHGQIKLLEDENTHDLCQIILNNLSMIKRDKEDKKNKKVLREDVLIVEHKIFFKEEYRAIYDKKNKNIRAKYDKKRQDLHRDVCLATDYKTAVIYEAFTEVYQDQIAILSTQKPDHQEVLYIQILRGKMSGNITLRVTFLNHQEMVKEMCLFSEKEQRSHKICSEIIHVGAGQPEQSTLAFVISLEKLYGMEETIVVRAIIIEKWDQNLMMKYLWNPEARPQEGATQFNSETLYLVKKNNKQYCRVIEYEILNTEVRALLFMHSYGYIQTNVDFGNIRRYLEEGENRRVNYHSMIGSEDYIRESININIQEPAMIDVYKGLNNLIFRQFCVIRVRSKEEKNQVTMNDSRHSDSKGESDPYLAMGPSNSMEMKEVNHYALVAIFEDGHCIEKGMLIIKVVIQEIGLDIITPVEIINQVYPVKQLSKILKKENKISICDTIIDKLVITQSQDRITMQLEKDIKPMSEFISESKLLKFKQMLRTLEGREDDNKIEMEIKDVSILNVSLLTLADCPKTSQMTLINQKLYKVTAHFVSNHRGFEPKMPSEARIFEWHFVYLEVAHRANDQQITFGVTEKDIVSILQKLRQKMRVDGKDLKRELISKKMSRDSILNLILDCFVMDPETYEVSLSMLHLHLRFTERSTLEEQFTVTGGRFLQIVDGQDPELQQFKTVIPQTELTKKLLINHQKDMSDKSFDVKIYELSLKSIPGAKKIRFEIFWVEEPDITFRCDMFSSNKQDGSQIIIEKINLVEQLEQLKVKKGDIQEHEYDPTKFAKDGLVLSIYESTFPHQICFMLIEPLSNIQWESHYKDDKLNIIETRQQRLNLVTHLRDSLVGGILRGIKDQDRAMEIQPGEQQFSGEEQIKDTFYFIGSVSGILINQREDVPYELIYAQSLEISQGVFRNVTLLSEHNKNKIILRLEPLNEDSNDRDQQRGLGTSVRGSSYQFMPPTLTGEGYREVHISLSSQMEGSRIICGCMCIGNQNDGLATHQKNLIYTVEIACALNRKEKAIRFTLYNQIEKRAILNVVFADNSMFERGINQRTDQEYSLKAGFQHSLPIVKQMSSLSYDYQQYEINEEVKLKLENSKEVDLMRDFKDPPQDKPGSLGMRSKDDDSAFVSLQKLKDRIINRSLKDSTLLYRKVVRLEKGKKNVILSVLREDNPMFGQTDPNSQDPPSKKKMRKPINQERYMIKLIIFENKRIENKLSHPGMESGRTSMEQSRLSQEQAQPSHISVQQAKESIFVYRYDEIFSQEQLESGELIEVSTMKRIIAQVINRRLKIREIPDYLEVAASAPSGQHHSTKSRYIAFFLDESQLCDIPVNPLTQKVDILEGRSQFDMRQLHSFSLLEPSIKVIPGVEQTRNSLLKQNLIYQFEKDDLLYEVFEISNPSNISIRLMVYNKYTYKMLTSCDIGENALRMELARDRKTYLAGPQQREELAKYIINNSFFDEKEQSLTFMVSNLIEEYDDN